MDDVEICLFNWKSRYGGNIMCLEFFISKNKNSNRSLKILGHLIRDPVLEIEGDVCCR